METKFTPGPWKECRNGDCTCGHVWSIPGDFPVCTVSGDEVRHVAVAHEHMADAPDVIYQSITPEMCAANARLIAAAPELFEALTDCVAVLTDPVVGTIYHDEPDWYGALDKAVTKARAALKKARGE
jgi:hypothetical protein